MSPGRTVAVTDPGEVTELLLQIDGGGSDVVDRLFPKVYGELQRIAASRLRAEGVGHTLRATALVHEAYLRLVNQRRVDWNDRAHFFAIAARAMRRVLLDYAAERNAQKRGGGQQLVTLGEESAGHETDLDEILALDQAMTRLSDVDERAARVVELRFFAGMKLVEIAAVLGISLATAERDWRAARAFLTEKLRG